MANRAVESEHLEIDGPAGPIEVLRESPAQSRGPIAVVCHPHPLHGGTMTNKVAHTLARTFYRWGATAVRFNFRGVGRSGGAYADGIGEQEDALAVVEWARAASPDSALLLGGFSFGAGVAAVIAPRVSPVGLVTVAPPVGRLPEGVEPPPCPWLIAHGAEDELVPLADLEAWRGRFAPQAELSVIDGASHFFHGKLNDLGNAVTRFLAERVVLTDSQHGRAAG